MDDVNALLKDGKTAEAEAKLRAFPPDLDPDGDVNERVRQALADLPRADDFKKLEATVARALGEGRPQDALDAIAAARGTLGPSRAAALERLRLKPLIAAGTQKVRLRLEEKKAAGQKRVDEIRDRIASEAKERETTRARIAEALKAEMDKTPAEFEMGKVRAFNAVVDAFDGRRLAVSFKLEQGSGSTSIALGALPAALAARVWPVIFKEAPPRQLFELGRELVRQKNLDDAERLFKKAVEGDPTLRASMPDLARIRRGLASLAAEIKTVDRKKIQLAYSWKDADQAADFAADASRIGSGGGKLRVEALGTLFFAVHKDIAFVGAASLEVALGGTSPGAYHVAGVKCTDAKGAVTFLLVIVDPGIDRVQVQRIKDRKAEVVKDIGGMKSVKSLEFQLQGEQARVITGGKTQWSGAIDRFARLEICLGGVLDDTARAGACVEFGPVKVTGTADPRWMRKLLAEGQTIIEQELSRDVQRERPAGPVSMGAGTTVASETLYDDMVQDLPDALRRPFDDARKVVVAYVLGMVDGKALEKARLAFASLIHDYPEFPLSYYYDAQILLLMGFNEDAEKRLDEALKVEPQFIEALLIQARLAMDKHDYPRTEKLLSEVLARVPDEAGAYFARGLMRHYLRQPEPATADLDLCLALAPRNPQIRREARRLRNAVHGPLWSQTTTVKTAHYVVTSDMPAAEVKKYAEHLEAIRERYVKFVGTDVKPAATPEVLIFETAEGYYGYAQLTNEDRLESTLGLFHPLYNQLLLFDGPDPEETFTTLYHEAFHQFLNELIPGAPPWFNEGLAEYVGGTKIENGKVVQTGVLISGRTDTLAQMLDQGLVIPFPTILRLGQDQFTGPAGPLCYAQAWSMVHFFINAADGAHLPLFNKYWNALSGGADVFTAYDTAFRDVDMRKLQEEWTAYVRGWFR